MTPQAIRAIRVHLDVTQEEFAHILGCSFGAISRWEQGKNVPIKMQRSILEFLSESLREPPDPAIVATIKEGPSGNVAAMISRIVKQKLGIHDPR